MSVITLSLSASDKIICENEEPYYQGTLNGYISCLKDEYGSFNMVDSIDKFFIQNTSNVHPINIIRIRRIQNDELFPYDSAFFVEWYKDNKIDPCTREDLSYIESRVELKQECLHYFDRTFLREAFSSMKHQIMMFKTLIRAGSLDLFPTMQLLPLRACVDPLTLEYGHYLFNIDFEKSKSVLQSAPIGSWIIRRSSPCNDKSLMKNAELVSFSRIGKRPTSGDKFISHHRFIHVDGVGWYQANRNLSNTCSFAIFLTGQKSKLPIASCFVDLIELYRADRKLSYKHLLVPSILI